MITEELANLLDLEEEMLKEILWEKVILPQIDNWQEITTEKMEGLYQISPEKFKREVTKKWEELAIPL